MIKKEYDRALINRFLEQKLTEKDRELLEKKLSEEEFADEVATEVVNVYGQMELKEQLKSIDSKLAKNRQISINRRKKYLSMAAVLLMLVPPLGYWFWNPNTPSQQSIFNQYFEPYDRMHVPRTNGTYRPEWQQIANLYSTEDYTNVIPLLESLASHSPEDRDRANFYLGICYLTQKKPQESISSLKRVLDQDNNYHLQTKWYLALAYLLTGNDEAEMLLMEIVDVGDYQSKEAAEILKSYFEDDN